MYIIVSVIAGFALGTAIFAVQETTKLKRRVRKLEELTLVFVQFLNEINYGEK